MMNDRSTVVLLSVGYIFNLPCLDSLYFVSAGALSTRLYTVCAVYVPGTFRTVLLSSTSLPPLVWLICNGGKKVRNANDRPPKAYHDLDYTVVY